MLLIPLHQHPIRSHKPPLRTLRHQFLDCNTQRRVISPALSENQPLDFRVTVLPSSTCSYARVALSIPFLTFPSARVTALTVLRSPLTCGTTPASDTAASFRAIPLVRHLGCTQFLLTSQSQSCFSSPTRTKRSHSY